MRSFLRGTCGLSGRVGWKEMSGRVVGIFSIWAAFFRGGRWR